MSLQECLEQACQTVPGLKQGALALLPEGLLVGGVGPGGAFDHEPLVRSAARCLAGNALTGADDDDELSFVEHVFVGREEVVLILQGRRYPRLALVLVCSLEPNLAFVLTSTRGALRALEATVDLAAWEL
ncbi:MAG TPA: hypothetical protein VHP33_02285 [Polyangiaceae bacterium]|nr:hypothetical protein [Polyangiaceae bacterium]